jgi:1-acyl-sn-glycerol-3-phosphate acyltransferase
MTIAEDADQSYDRLLEQARKLYPGIRVGKPGRSRGYLPMIATLRALRTRYDVELEGRQQVGTGAAILVGNHTHVLDPVVVVMSTWWKVSAFTKVEWFQHRLAPFFRVMGQIPLRRGDEESTAWAMEMSEQVLNGGWKLGIYPEGTRSPDAGALHRLHKRILIPLLQANPDVPVHVVFTKFGPNAGVRRRKVLVRISPRLVLNPRTMDAETMTGIIRDALLDVGQLRYVDRYARDVKAERQRPSAAAAD